MLIGFPHIVTVTDHHVAAGCEIHSPDVWRNRGAAIIRSHGYYDKADEWLQIILSIADAHGCVSEKQEAAS
jgi:hypothetical protein